MNSNTMFIEKQSQNLYRDLDVIQKKYNVQKPLKVCVASKYANVTQIETLINQGFRIFGENKIQDGVQKIKALNKYELEWHFIGHLQKNKVRKAVEHFDVIQSVDSIELLEKIDNCAASLNKKMSCFIQINSGYDQKKHGFLPEEFKQLKSQLFSFSNVKIKGIMVIAPLLSDQKKLKSVFDMSFDLFKATFKEGNAYDLSMGMSQDYQLAIESGATMVRIGRRLFNE